jgi:hypothetical protein
MVAPNSSPKPRFSLGHIVATPGAVAALDDAGQQPAEFLNRHVSGSDWGDLSDDDKKLNDAAIAHEGDVDRQDRIMSAYLTAKGQKLWIVTEYDRSVTTLLLPSEY